MAANAEADALFAETDTCTNTVAHYTVTYPDSWYTNTDIGVTPACSWFSPTFYEVTDEEEVPSKVVIVFRYAAFVQAIASIGGTHTMDTQAMVIDGKPARRSEEVGVGGGFIPPGSYRYEYVVAPGGRFPDGGRGVPVLWASTSWQIEDDVAAYERDRAVLDRIIASLRFEDS